VLEALGRPVDHLALLETPVAREPFVQRGSRLLEHARAAKALKLSNAAAERAKVENQALTSKLDKLVAYQPDAAALLGMSRPTFKRGQMPRERAELLLRHAFTPSCWSNVGVAGVKKQRLQCFAEELGHELQQHGFYSMLWRCAKWKKLHRGNGVVLGIRFESDCTAQSLGQYLLQRIGRPSKRRLKTEVW
jgi:hypothetical protein